MNSVSPAAQANQSLLNTKDETITLYAGQPAAGSGQVNSQHSPPAQIIRHPGQLLVTDNKTGQAGQTPLPNQLQLPQRPMPPGLPKPVSAEVHKPKLIPGKVALCPNCGGFSVDISKCTGCRKIIKEGCKIMNDPDYKPPPGENDKKIVITGPPDLRNVRIQPKQRRKTANEEPECIALSSDEEADEEEETDKAQNDENEAKEQGANKDQADTNHANSGENGETSEDNGKKDEGMSDFYFDVVAFEILRLFMFLPHLMQIICRILSFFCFKTLASKNDLKKNIHLVTLFVMKFNSK